MGRVQEGWKDSNQETTAIKRLINRGLEGTSTTCVLIGSQTFNRPWVTYEIMNSFKRGNFVFAVHIDSITGKDKKTKSLGPNPLNYLGVTYSDSGLTATLHDKIEGKWIEYTAVDGCASYQTGGVASKYRGQGFNFGQLFPTYDWIDDDGYNNFATWVG